MEPEERDEIVARTAERIWGHYDADFVSKALEHVERVQASYDPSRGNFSNWCYTVLYNLRQQRFRQIRSETAALTRYWQDGRAALTRDWEKGKGETEGTASYGSTRAEWEEAVQSWKARLGKISEILCDLRGDFQTAQERVNYYAVLILRMRRIAIHLHLRAISPEDVASLVENGSVASYIERLLPWQDGEAGLVLREGLPSLATIWNALRSTVNVPPYCFDVGVLCMNVNHLMGATVLSDVQWSQWVTRAKNRLRSKVAEAVWSECFAPFFPDSGHGLMYERERGHE